MKHKTDRLFEVLFASVMVLSLLISIVFLAEIAQASEVEDLESKISKVTLSDIQVPIVGKPLNGTYSILSSEEYEKHDSSQKICWTRMDGNYAISCGESEMVKEGETYFATIMLSSKTTDRPFDASRTLTITANTFHGSDIVTDKIVDIQYKLSHDDTIIEITLTFRACRVYDYTYELRNMPGVIHSMPNVGDVAWDYQDVFPNPNVSEELDTLSLTWYKSGTDEYLMPNDVFQEGQEYQLSLFINDGKTAIIKPGTIIVYYDENTSLYFQGELDEEGFVITESAFTPVDPVLHEITLCEFTLPVVGDTVNSHKRVHADTPFFGATFELINQIWYDQSGNILSGSYEFERTVSYYCEFILKPLNNWHFEDDTIVTLQDCFGDTIALSQVCLQNDGTLLARTELFLLGEDIDALNIYDCAPPTAGRTANECFPQINSNASYEFTRLTWHNNSDDIDMSNNDVFEAGKEYSLTVVVCAKPGYNLNEKTQVVMTSEYSGVFVKTILPVFVSGNLVFSTESMVAKEAITDPLQIGGYKSPLVGSTSDSISDLLTVPISSGYEIEHVGWVDTDFRPLGRYAKLQAGKQYGLYVELVPKNGYHFSVLPQLSSLIVEGIYGERVEYLWDEASSCAFGYLPGTDHLFFFTNWVTPKEVIDCIEFSLNEPIVGELPDYTASYPTDAHYYSANDLASVGKTYQNDIMWDFMDVGNKFRKSDEHYLDMVITACDGYLFSAYSDVISVVFNDYEIQRYNAAVSIQEEDKLSIFITFDSSFKYKVSFVNFGNGLTPQTQYVSKGKTVTRPDDPSAEGWVFGGWYTDPACTQAYNFSTPVTTDIILYAKWTESRFGMIRQATASFEGKIILNFYLLLSDDVLADNGAYVLLTGGSQNRKILVKDAAVKVVNGETRYCFTYPVVAKELRDNINLKIYDSNDSVIKLTNVAGNNDYTTSGVNYSLMTYCTKMLESSTSSQTMKDLAQATIDYGTAAQIYFNYNAAGLSVGDRVTSVTLADLEQYKGVFSGSLPTGVTKRTLTALFEEDNSLRIYFTYDSGYTPDMYTYTIDGKSAPIHVKHGENGDEYYLEVKGVQSNKLGKTHDLTISNSSTTYTITVSVLTYARSSVSNGTTDRQNLGKALYCYYLAAKAMFGE